MRSKSRKIVVLFTLALLLVALPTSTVLANKQAWKSAISYSNELHQVVESTSKGSGNFGTNPDGSLHFIVSVRGLSGAPTGVHLHASADSNQNAGVVVTLCGSGPGIPVFSGACPFNDGVMVLEGDINGYNLTGIGGGAFFTALHNELVYVNVHTALNPSGEARGQLISR